MRFFCLRVLAREASYSYLIVLRDFKFELCRKTVLDRGFRIDRRGYHANTRCALPLPLASAAPRRTPHRASAQLMTWQLYYARQPILNHHPYLSPKGGGAVTRKKLSIICSNMQFLI